MEHKREDQRVHDCDAHPADRYAGSIYLTRPLPLLRILGAYADTDVPVNWYLGRPAKDLCYNKVFHIHNGRECVDAGCHIGTLLQVLQRDGRIHI